MRRRVVEEVRPQVEVPEWVTHLEAGLRHVGSVTPAGHVSLEGVDRLYAARDEWARENSYDAGDVS